MVAGVVALWLGLLVASAPARPGESRIDRVISNMDGRAFARIASDPTFARATELYDGNAARSAFRAMRPVQGWVDWAASLGGRPALIGPAILLLGVVFIGLLPLAIDAVARAHGRRSGRGELVLVTPAVVAFLLAPGLCEPLAACLGLWGLARWQDGRRRDAVVLLTLAVLTRETSLLLAFGLALSVVADTRRLRPALPLLIPPAAYVGWALVVRARIGTFPAGSENLGAPFEGLRAAIPLWNGAEWLAAVGLAACAVAIWRSAVPTFRWILGVHLVSLAFMGTIVMQVWWGWGRVLLPVFLLALVLPAAADAQATEAEEPASGEAVPEVARAEPVARWRSPDRLLAPLLAWLR